MGVGGRPRGQTMHIAVVHAKRGGNRDCIVNFFIGCALLPCASDIFICDLLSASLYYAGNREPGFQLLRNCGYLEIRLFSVDELLISVEPVSSHSTMSVLTEVAIVLR